MSTKKDQSLATKLIHADRHYSDNDIGPAISVSSSKSHYWAPAVALTRLWGSFPIS